MEDKGYGQGSIKEPQHTWDTNFPLGRDSARVQHIDAMSFLLQTNHHQYLSMGGGGG